MVHREILHRVSFAHVCGDALIGASAGLALYSAFPPIGWWWMTIPALALFISRIDEARAPRALTVTVAFGMSMWLPLIDWVPMAVGMKPAWFVLAFAQTLFLCGWVLFTRWTQLWSWARDHVGRRGCRSFALAVVGLPLGVRGSAAGGWTTGTSGTLWRDDRRDSRRHLPRGSDPTHVRLP